MYPLLFFVFLVYSVLMVVHTLMHVVDWTIWTILYLCGAMVYGISANCLLFVSYV